MSVQVSQEELADLSLACAKLWELDSDRLEPGRDYQLDLQVRALSACSRHLALCSPHLMGECYVQQVGKKSYQQQDVAAKAAVCISQRSGLCSPDATYAAFCSLLDNYER